MEEEEEEPLDSNATDIGATLAPVIYNVGT